jgi:hypothetical protein
MLSNTLGTAEHNFAEGDEFTELSSFLLKVDHGLIVSWFLL